MNHYHIRCFAPKLVPLGIEGDRCLKLVADALDKALDKAVWRTGDLVARFGGEEFIVLLPTPASKMPV